MRDECLNEHLFPTLAAACRNIETWRTDYNTVRPHSSPGGLAPAEFTYRPRHGHMDIEAKLSAARKWGAGHRQRIISPLIQRIDLAEDELTITLDRSGVQQLLGTKSDGNDRPIELATSATRIRQGKDVCMIVGDGQALSTDMINRPLVSLLAEAHDLHQALIADPHHTVASLADGLGKCRKRSARLLRVAHLAPDIVAHYIAGTQPVSLTTKTLLNIDLPIGWKEQRALLGVN